MADAFQYDIFPIFLSYARMDAAKMLDEDLDEKTANRVGQAIGLPPSADDSFIGKHQLGLAVGFFVRVLTSAAWHGQLSRPCCRRLQGSPTLS
jgi:hypothetical protein